MEQDNKLKWVTDAYVFEDYKLHLTFNDGKQCVFDCLPLIEKYSVYAPLRDKKIFECLNLDGWTVNWADGTIDIAPEYLYEKSVEPTD